VKPADRSSVQAMIHAQDAPARIAAMTPTETTPNPSTGASDATTAKVVDCWHYGLNAIAKRMGWSTWKVLTANQQLAFPLLRLPSSHGRHWMFATSDLLIAQWLHVQTGMAYEHVAQTALGRKLRATRASNPIPNPAQSPNDSASPSDTPPQPLDIATNPDRVL